MFEVAPMQTAIKASNPRIVAHFTSPIGIPFEVVEHPFYGDEPLLVKWNNLYYTSGYWEPADVEPDFVEACLGGAY